MLFKVFMKIFFMGTGLLCLTGCGARQLFSPYVAHVPVNVPKAPEPPLLTKEELARIHDFPFPLHVQPVKLLLTESQMVLTYTTTMRLDKLISLYRTEMDYWGWEELGTVEALESCLFFGKPSKYCTLFLRSEGQETRVTVFTTLKLESCTQK